MTKKAIVLIPLLLLCFSVFAQETKPWIFIGICRSAPGPCADWTLVREEINDMNEFKLRRQRFLDDHIGLEPRTQYISEEHCVIICEFKTKKDKCFPTGYQIFRAYSLEGCKKAMETDRKLFETSRSVQPVTVFERQAIGRKQN